MISPHDLKRPTEPLVLASKNPQRGACESDTPASELSYLPLGPRVGLGIWMEETRWGGPGGEWKETGSGLRHRV